MKEGSPAKKRRPDEIHFYEWSVSRWRASLARESLDATGRGIYRELLDTCYVQGEMPADPVILCRIAGCTRKQFNAAWPLLRRYFQPGAREGMLTNRQADEFRKNHFEYTAKQSANGRAGGRPPKNPNESGGFPVGYENEKPNESLDETRRDELRRDETRRDDDEPRASAPEPPPAVVAPTPALPKQNTGKANENKATWASGVIAELDIGQVREWLQASMKPGSPAPDAAIAKRLLELAGTKERVWDFLVWTKRRDPEIRSYGWFVKVIPSYLEGAA